MILSVAFDNKPAIFLLSDQVELLEHYFANGARRAIVGNTDQHDQVTLGEKTIRLQGILLCNYHIFLILCALVHVVELFELAHGLKIRLCILR